MSDTLLETLVLLKCNSAALGHVSPRTVNFPGHLIATQTMTKAVKAPCDCQLDSFDTV